MREMLPLHRRRLEQTASPYKHRHGALPTRGRCPPVDPGPPKHPCGLTIGKFTTALSPRICRAAASYARAASSAVSKVPSHSRQPRVGSRISAAYLPHGRWRTPRNFVVPFLFDAETLSRDCDLKLPPWLPPPPPPEPERMLLVPADMRRRPELLWLTSSSSKIRGDHTKQLQVSVP